VIKCTYGRGRNGDERGGSRRQRPQTETEEERERRARFVVIGKALQFGSTVIGALIVFLGAASGSTAD
jgi:hypothetical protein